MNIKKFTTYEFDLKSNDDEYHCCYKKDESDNANSFIELTDLNGENFKITLPLLASLFEAMKEVDPFGSIFDISGESK